MEGWDISLARPPRGALGCEANDTCPFPYNNQRRRRAGLARTTPPLLVGAPPRRDPHANER
eukprot:gene11888-21987_t